jgi:HPt (histidine-containing phosphotransfer) domain-containing protein
MTDYVTKPIGRRDLESILVKWTDASSAPATVDVPTPLQEDAGVGVPEPATAPPAAEPDASAVFDLACTLDRLDGDETLLVRLIEQFASEAESCTAAIRGALDRDDAGSVGSQSHKLKGALASVGGEAARSVAFELEKLGRAGDLARAGERFEVLVRELARLKSELDGFVATRAA